MTGARYVFRAPDATKPLSPSNSRATYEIQTRYFAVVRTRKQQTEGVIFYNAPPKMDNRSATVLFGPVRLDRGDPWSKPELMKLWRAGAFNARQPRSAQRAA